MKILIDPGHGSDTPGKRSPDGFFLEYKYNREIAHAVVEHLQLRGHDAELLVTEEYDVLLKERARRANAWCDRLGRENVCLVSIHVNTAASDGKWHNATGWSCYTSRGQTAGDRLADCLYKAAALHLPGHRLRTDNSDGDPDIEENFYILARTKCASCLSENGFMDCHKSLSYISSTEGKQSIIALHVEGIIDYITQT